jgi:hypothetical protein
MQMRPGAQIVRNSGRYRECPEGVALAAEEAKAFGQRGNSIYADA